MITKKYTLLIAITAVIVAVFLIKGGVDYAKRRISPPEPFDRKDAIRVAIVIDDMGYSARNVDDIFAINKRLTLSVLPHTPFSRKVALAAQNHGCELILHLPLEPYGDDEPREPTTLSLDMPPETIRSNMRHALDSVPGSRGVSNHMGSRATENERFMRIVFEELKQERLYFLDSMVTGKSVCQRLARDLGMKFARRDVYLDNEADTASIKKQLASLIETARRTGGSIGVGHDRPLTVKVLAEEMPRLEREGIEFVFVSELIRQY